MTASRRLLPLLWAGLVAQPACVVSRDGASGPGVRAAGRPEATVAAAGAPADRTDFATLIRGPGERVPAHDPDAGVMPRTFAASASEPAPVGPADANVPPVPVPERLPLPPPPDPPLLAAVRAYSDNHPEQAVKYLEALGKPNQELMLRLLPAVVRASQIDLARAGSADIETLAAPLEESAKELAARAPLRLDRACFCREVGKFGQYDPYPDRYPVPPDAVVTLYAEVRNARSEPSAGPAEGDGFVTRFAVSVQVRDAAGAVVAIPDKKQHPVPVLQDTSRSFTRSPVRDCCVVVHFHAPARPGEYGVRFEVHEPASGRSVSVPLRLRVQ